MTRELNLLIKKLKALSPDDIGRVQQFLLQLKSPELRGVPVELKAVQGEATPFEPALAEAEVAHEACAQWRRRPFQAIDADDLQPIAALFREAVDTRAASRFRFGGSR